MTDVQSPASDHPPDNRVADAPPGGRRSGRAAQTPPPPGPVMKLFMRVILIAFAVGAAWLVANVFIRPGSAPRSDATFGPIVAEIQRENPDVVGSQYSDNLLMIRLAGDWSDAGATRFACETVKPILAAHGLGDQMFALYDRHGAVIATGSRCP